MATLRITSDLRTLKYLAHCCERSGLQCREEGGRGDEDSLYGEPSDWEESPAPHAAPFSATPHLTVRGPAATVLAFAAVCRTAASGVACFAEQDWQEDTQTKATARRKKKRWINVKTGKVQYLETNPGLAKGRGKKGEQPAQPQEQPAEEPQGSDEGGEVKAAQATIADIMRGSSYPVHGIGDLRAKMPPELQGDAFDKAMIAMRDAKQVVLAGDDSQERLKAKGRASYVDDRGHAFGYVTRRKLPPAEPAESQQEQPAEQPSQPPEKPQGGQGEHAPGEGKLTAEGLQAMTPEDLTEGKIQEIARAFAGRKGMTKNELLALAGQLPGLKVSTNMAKSPLAEKILQHAATLAQGRRGEDTVDLGPKGESGEGAAGAGEEPIMADRAPEEEPAAEPRGPHADLTDHLKGLYENAHTKDVTHKDFKNARHDLGKLSKADVIGIAKELGIQSGLISKSAAIDRIVGRMEEKKGRFERSTAFAQGKSLHDPDFDPYAPSPASAGEGDRAPTEPAGRTEEEPIMAELVDGEGPQEGGEGGAPKSPDEGFSAAARAAVALGVPGARSLGDTSRPLAERVEDLGNLDIAALDGVVDSPLAKQSGIHNNEFLRTLSVAMREANDAGSGSEAAKKGALRRSAETFDRVKGQIQNTVIPGLRKLADAGVAQDKHGDPFDPGAFADFYEQHALPLIDSIKGEVAGGAAGGQTPGKGGRDEGGIDLSSLLGGEAPGEPAAPAGKGEGKNRQRLLDLIDRSADGPDDGSHAEKGLMDRSTAEKLGTLVKDHLKGKTPPLSEVAEQIDMAGRNFFPDDETHREVSAALGEMLNKASDEEVAEAVEGRQLPGYRVPFGETKGGTYPPLLDKANPGYAKFLRDRLGAKPEGGKAELPAAEAGEAPGGKGASPAGGGEHGSPHAERARSLYDSSHETAMKASRELYGLKGPEKARALERFGEEMDTAAAEAERTASKMSREELYEALKDVPAVGARKGDSKKRLAQKYRGIVDEARDAVLSLEV